MNNDQDLRELFTSAKREDARRRPDFDELLQRSPEPVSPFPWPALAGAALLLVLALLPLSFRPDPDLRWQQPSIVTWKSPTDFLLASPGAGLLTTLPRIGETTVSSLPVEEPQQDQATQPSHQELP